MNTIRSPHDHPDHIPADQHQPVETQSRSHHWMMMACCLPMIAIAIALMTTQTAGAGFFVVIALGCTVMMALMMRGMDHANRH